MLQFSTKTSTVIFT